MPNDDTYANRDSSVGDTIERLRAEHFKDVDRELVLEILRLHADGVVADNVARSIDEAIAERVAEGD